MSQQEAGDVLAQVRAHCPEALQPQLYEIEDAWERKLWHQLTQQLLALYQRPESLPYQMPLFSHFIGGFKKNINQLKLVTLGLHANAGNETPLPFLTELADSVNNSNSQDAYVFAKVELARVKMLMGDMEEARLMLDECGKILDTFDSVETVIYAAYYRINADYHKIEGEYAAYYKSALLHLSCVELDEMPAEEKSVRAYELSLAAVLGETTYNFGELLLHPILDALKDTEHSWLRDLLFAMNAGDIAKFDALSGHFTKQPLFQQNLAFLRQKICLTSLTEAVFRCPPHARQLTFDTIASETRLVSNEVEILVMKALSLDLIRGSIDQVGETVLVNWVQPRVLDRNQIAGMRDRLVEWNHTVTKLGCWVQKEGKDIWAQ